MDHLIVPCVTHNTRCRVGQWLGANGMSLLRQTIIQGVNSVAPIDYYQG